MLMGSVHATDGPHTVTSVWCLHNRQGCITSCVTHAKVFSHVHYCDLFNINPKGQAWREHREEGEVLGGRRSNNSQRKFTPLGFIRGASAAQADGGRCCFVALLAHLLHVQ